MRELRNLLERACLLCDGELLGADEVAQALEMGRLDGGLQAFAGAVQSGAASAAAGAAGSPAAVATAGSGTAPAPADATGAPASGGLRALEAEALRARVLAHRGTRDALAAELGISPRTLHRRLRALGLDG
ncbi:helix-turn-helix domain-containing protein [Derxia gummosa]|uniref:Helix-turn-helix domain-containing protein n=1 Tax=Derxia gummosa DSM 723 TaxID=1121388 RepID=A0A8B6X2Y5_9BURK|nr:helix-turn-helix domain-containing protein [Derxia gummosa]